MPWSGLDANNPLKKSNRKPLPTSLSAENQVTVVCSQKLLPEKAADENEAQHNRCQCEVIAEKKSQQWEAERNCWVVCSMSQQWRDVSVLLVPFFSLCPF